MKENILNSIFTLLLGSCPRGGTWGCWGSKTLAWGFAMPLKDNMQNKNRAELRGWAPIWLQPVARKGRIDSKMVLKRKINAAQIKRYREPLNIGRSSLYNLRVRQGTTQSKETKLLTIRSDASAT